MASQSKPKEWAKVAGRPWRVTGKEGASDGRALRARRCSLERRQCARCARVKIPPTVEVTGAGIVVVPQVRQTVSLRTTLSHARRMPQRGQSFHTTGARGNGGGASEHMGGEAEGEGSCGHNTALTRRGLIVVLLS
jgi:hypothetical protein